MSTINGIPFDAFDPNNLNNGYTLWACWTGRGFKTFSTRAAALNCFSSWSPAKLYEYTPAQGWVERAVKNRNTASDVCDHCGAGGLKATYRSWENSDASFQWRRKNGKITSPPELLHVCRPCAGSVRNG